jgi:hypothetical protein
VKKLAVSVAGIVISLLGLLWLLQGAGIVHLRPVLCFANCEEITGTSYVWAVIGMITFVSGIILIVMSFKKKPR